MNTGLQLKLVSFATRVKRVTLYTDCAEIFFSRNVQAHPNKLNYVFE